MSFKRTNKSLNSLLLSFISLAFVWCFCCSLQRTHTTLWKLFFTQTLASVWSSSSLQYSCFQWHFWTRRRTFGWRNNFFTHINELFSPNFQARRSCCHAHHFLCCCFDCYWLDERFLIPSFQWNFQLKRVARNNLSFECPFD